MANKHMRSATHRNDRFCSYREAAVYKQYNTCVIQHMFSRNNIIPKDGDRVHVTPLQFAITYFSLSNTQLNVTDLLIQYIVILMIVRDLNFHRKPNLALGHLIAYILEVKYGIIFPSTLNHIPSRVINHSFHIFYDHRRHPTKGATQATKEDEHFKAE